jgi:septal ring factor EnvC (AmiA/AmiB activator)
MKSGIIFIMVLMLPLFGVAQNNAMRMGEQHMNNQRLMKRMMTPEKIDIQKMVKREESKIEKLQIENNKLNTELEELESNLAVLDDSKNEKTAKKIEKIEKKIEENNQLIANSKIFVLSYKKE